MNITPRILIVKTSSMGDILHMLPALSDAARIFPQAHFDWVIEENFSEIPHWHPNIHQVIPIAIRRWRKTWWQKQTRNEYQRFKKQLQAQEYDHIIDAQGLLKSVMVAKQAKGMIHGYDWHSAREPLASLFYNVKHSVSKQLHAIERSRQLFAKTLNYAIPTELGHYNIENYFPPTQSVTDSPYWIFLHSTTWDSKHWPETHWQTLINLLQNSGIHIMLPWGNQKEKERAQRLAQHHTNVTVLPRCTLAELAQRLNQAQGIISVDTGLSHLSAALGRPNITLFGPTDPGLVGGYGKNQYILCGSKNQMANIQPETVLQKMFEIIQLQN